MTSKLFALKSETRDNQCILGLLDNFIFVTDTITAEGWK